MGMTKMMKHSKLSRKPRRHAKHKLFTKECEILRKDYMFEKNSLSNSNVTAEERNEFHESVKTYKKTVPKTKKLYIKKFHDDIRCLKTQNPKEFWKLINKESDHSCSASEITEVY